MIIGVLTIELEIVSAISLKDKRKVLNRIKDRVRNKFNVSIAEVEANDVLNHASLGVVMVCNEQKFANKALCKVTDLIEEIRDCHLSDYAVEFLRVG